MVSITILGTSRSTSRVFEQLKRRDEERDKKSSDATSAIRKRQKADKDKKRKERKRLKSSLPKKDRPTSLDSFETVVVHRLPHHIYNCYFVATKGEEGYSLQ